MRNTAAVIAKEVKGQCMATTQKTLDAEVAMLQFARDGQGKFAAARRTDRQRSVAGPFAKSSARRRCHILKSRDRVVGVRGGAGHRQNAHDERPRLTRIREASAGEGVCVRASSAQASRGVLKKDGFKDAETLEMLLQGREAAGSRRKGQVLWVDEAGLVSSQGYETAVRCRQGSSNRVVLSGDYRQHASVEAGDAFRLLESEAGVRFAELTEIRRQKTPITERRWRRSAKARRKGAQKGFERSTKWARLSRPAARSGTSMLVGDYLKAVEDGKSALIIAPTHAEGERLTDGLREALKERGAIGKEHGFMVRKSTGWTEAQKGDARNYQPGMVVEFNQNVKGFTKGEKAVVVHGGRRRAPAEAGRHADAAAAGRRGSLRGVPLRVRSPSARATASASPRNGIAKVEGRPRARR